MAQRLLRKAGRLVLRGGRRVLGACGVCCGDPAGLQFYIRVCACYNPADGLEGDPVPEEGDLILCQTPLQSCVYLPLIGDAGVTYAAKLELSDEPGVRIIDRLGELLAASERGEPYTCVPMAVSAPDDLAYLACYSITGGLYVDPAATEEQRLAFLAAHGLDERDYPDDLPGDAFVPAYGVDEAGEGNVVALDRKTACGHASGCGMWPSGPPYREATRCDGGDAGYRFFVCAGNLGQSVIGPDGQCWCIGRGERFDAVDVDALVDAELAHKTTSTDNVRWWKYDAHALFYCAPAPCCWCLSQTVVPSPCLAGKVYRQVPESTLWATTDLCCGTRTGNALRVEISYRKTHAGTYTDTGEAFSFVDEVVGPPRYTDNPTGTGGTLVEIDLRSQATIGGVTSYDVVSTYSVMLQPTCVLFGDPNNQVPWPIDVAGFTAHPLGGGPGPTGDCTPQVWLAYDGDFNNPSQIADAIGRGPWASLISRLVPSGGGTVVRSGSFRTDRPSKATAVLDESLDDGDYGEWTMHFRLTVRVENDQSEPCGPRACGNGGIDGVPAWEMLP